MKIRRLFWYFAILAFGKYERVFLDDGTALECARLGERRITIGVWRGDELR